MKKKLKSRPRLQILVFIKGKGKSVSKRVTTREDSNYYFYNFKHRRWKKEWFIIPRGEKLTLPFSSLHFRIIFKQGHQKLRFSEFENTRKENSQIRTPSPWVHFKKNEVEGRGGGKRYNAFINAKSLGVIQQGTSTYHPGVCIINLVTYVKPPLIPGGPSAALGTCTRRK